MKNTADLILRVREKNGEFGKPIKVNGLVEKWTDTMELVHRLENKVNLLDLKFMNSIKICILFHLEGLKEAIRLKGSKAQKNLPLYVLSGEILKLIDAINHDLKFEYINVYEIREIIKELADIYILIKEENDINIVSANQLCTIDYHFYIMILSFNTRVASQIQSIRSNQFWLSQIPDQGYFINLRICN